MVKLIVSNLPPDLSNNALADMFREYTHHSLERVNSATAVVLVDDMATAKLAMKSLDGMWMNSFTYGRSIFVKVMSDE